MPSSASRGRRSSRVDSVVQNDIGTSNSTKHSNNTHHISLTTTRLNQRLWPFSPTLESLIAFFPIGSIWLHRLETDEVARLHFFHHLHKFYDHPLMRLSSSNKHRAQDISTYILELESQLKHKTRAAIIPYPKRTPNPTPTPTSIPSSRSRNGGQKSRRKHRNPRKRVSSLTKQNLAVLEESPLEGEISAPPSPKSTEVYMEKKPSKAFVEEQEETFARKRQSQIETEAKQLKMMAKG